MAAIERRVKDVAKQVADASEAPAAGAVIDIQPKLKLDAGTQILSTGCTLLDLGICGKRSHGGGVPTGIMVEIAGESGAGKTAVAVEIAASIAAKKGRVKFLDPEGRLDQAYAEIYGADLKGEHYARPNTVMEVFEDHVYDWDKRPFEGIDLLVCDSAAALSTEIELESKDKMGMKRAKDFSEGCRKSARIIANKSRIMIWTNQLRDGENGFKVTPGGNAIPFYSSLRLHMKQVDKIIKTATVGEKGKSVEKIIGIWSEVFVKKNSIDDPFRKIKIPIVFGFGIDDVRSNLQYLKDINGWTTYQIPGTEKAEKGYVALDAAIRYIEKENLEAQLRETVITTWETVEQQFVQERKQKVRF